MTDPTAMATALGLGPWQNFQDMGRDIIKLKRAVANLQDAKRNGSVPCLNKQLENLELRSGTARLDGTPQLPLMPPDYWIAPKLTQAVADIKVLEAEVSKLNKDMAIVATALNVDLTQPADDDASRVTTPAAAADDAAPEEESDSLKGPLGLAGGLAHRRMTRHSLPLHPEACVVERPELERQLLDSCF